MIIQTLSFYMFAFLAVAAGFMVISAKNPVHSVLFLIMTFFNAAGLFVLLGAEFLAMLLVVVYVGAVAVLFLFVVMMLDVNFVVLRQGFLQYLPIGASVGLVLVLELFVVIAGGHFAPEVAGGVSVAPAAEVMSNTHALGSLIYTHYVYQFQVAGLVLLVAMIGAIVLTHRRRTDVKRQNIARQNARRPQDTVELKKVEPGRGI